MPTALITRLTRRLFGSPLLRNSIRGELVEEMVAQALEPEWALCADDWGACDLKQVSGPLRIQVKQSAARQSWHADNSPLEISAGLCIWHPSNRRGSPHRIGRPPGRPFLCRATC